MATENWSAAELVNRPSLEDFHSAFDVVFVDTTGYVNLCADMSASHYRLVFTLLHVSMLVILCLVHSVLNCNGSQLKGCLPNR